MQSVSQSRAFVSVNTFARDKQCRLNGLRNLFANCALSLSLLLQLISHILTLFGTVQIGKPLYTENYANYHNYHKR